MKVLILSSSNNIGKIASVLGICETFDVEAFTYRFNVNSNSNILSCLEENNLILIILDNEIIMNEEIIFSIGYCIGKGKAFVFLYVM